MYFDNMFLSNDLPLIIKPDETIKLIAHTNGEDGFWRYGVTDDGVLEVTWEKKLVSKS